MQTALAGQKTASSVSNNKKTDRFGLERFGFTDKEAGGGSAALKDCSNVREAATQGSGISTLQIRNFIYGSRVVYISRGWRGLGLIAPTFEQQFCHQGQDQVRQYVISYGGCWFFLTLIKGEENQSRKKYITRPIMYKYLKRRPLHAL